MRHPTKLIEPEMTEARVRQVTRMMRVVRWRGRHPPPDVHFVLLSRPARRHEGGLAVIIVVCIVKVVRLVVIGRVVPRRPLAGLDSGKVRSGPVGGTGLGLVGGALVQVQRTGLLLPANPHSLLGRLEGLLLLLLGLLVWGGRVVLLLFNLAVRVGGWGGGGGGAPGDLIINLNLLLISLSLSLSLVLNSLIDLSERLRLTRRLRLPSPNKDGRQSLRRSELGAGSDQTTEENASQAIQI